MHLHAAKVIREYRQRIDGNGPSCNDSSRQFRMQSAHTLGADYEVPRRELVCANEAEHLAVDVWPVRRAELRSQGARHDP